MVHWYALFPQNIMVMQQRKVFDCHLPDTSTTSPHTAFENSLFTAYKMYITIRKVGNLSAVSLKPEKQPGGYLHAAC